MDLVKSLLLSGSLLNVSTIENSRKLDNSLSHLIEKSAMTDISYQYYIDSDLRLSNIHF